MFYFALGCLIIGGLYSVLIVGIKGGPNNGEHPLGINIGNGAFFYFLAGHWESARYTTYLILLIVCIVPGILTMRLRSDDFLSITSWVARGMLLICFAGFIILLVKPQILI